MASELKEIERILLNAGYKKERHGKHPIYSNGVSRITLPTGNVTSGRFRKWIKSQIRQRAKEALAKAG